MNNFNIITINRHRIAVDGDGITTLVGLKGCPLNCEFCINKKSLKEIDAKVKTPQELLEKVIIDYCYFISTGGGITFGGGEPLLQYKAILDFINMIPVGMNVNVETSMNVDIEEDILKELFEKMKTFIIDIKDLNKDIYIKYTGIDNDRVLKNLCWISENGFQDKCVIRVPLIPNYNTETDREKSVEVLNKMGFNHIDKFEYILNKAY